MTIQEMIAVLEAAQRGEEIEYRGVDSGKWKLCDYQPCWSFSTNDYRIAPKKEMTLVEELREGVYHGSIRHRAADRIEMLEEQAAYQTVGKFTTDELLAEIARRIGE